MPTSLLRRARAVAALVAAASLLAPAVAADPAHTPAKHTARPAAKVPQIKIGFAVPDAQPEQVKAAELVYYGSYDCEFKQSVSVAQNSSHPAYVDVKFGKGAWLMKPVLSSTGAIRLEDIRGEMLMVQIASKSMLLDVKEGHRLVDDCICPKQRELIAEAKSAQAAGQAAPTKLILDAGTSSASAMK